MLVSALGTKGSGPFSGQTSVTATCLSCYTTGTAVVTTDGVKKDDNILGDIIDWFKADDKTDLITKALGLDLKVQLDNLGGHFEFDIAFAAAGTYTVTLFKSETPVGVEVSLPSPKTQPQRGLNWLLGYGSQSFALRHRLTVNSWTTATK